MFTTSSRFAQGHSWTGVPKNILMGSLDMMSASEGRNDTSGVTKEPCYGCAEGTGGKNWPKSKKGSQKPDSYVI